MSREPKVRLKYFTAELYVRAHTSEKKTKQSITILFRRVIIIYFMSLLKRRPKNVNRPKKRQITYYLTTTTTTTRKKSTRKYSANNVHSEKLLWLYRRFGLLRFLSFSFFNWLCHQTRLDLTQLGFVSR